MRPSGRRLARGDASIRQRTNRTQALSQRIRSADGEGSLEHETRQRVILLGLLLGSLTLLNAADSSCRRTG